MNIQLSNAELKVIEEMLPEKIETYLVSTGWNKRKVVPEKVSIWSKDYQDKEARILLPLDKEFGDYAFRIEEIIGILATVERRWPAEIIGSLIRAKPVEEVNGMPRRAQVDLLTVTERMLHEVILDVETLGTHPLLVEVKMLLDSAKHRLADYVELDKPE